MTRTTLEKAGIVLLLIGLPLGWCISAWFNSTQNTVVWFIMFLSVVLLFSNIGFNRALCKPLLLVALYQFIIIIISWLTENPENPVYHLFFFAVIISMLLRGRKPVYLENNKFFIICGWFIAISVLYFSIKQNSGLSYSRQGVGYATNYVTICCAITFFLFYSLVFCKSKHTALYVFTNIVLIGVSLLCVMATFSRSAAFNFLIVLMVYFIKSKFKLRAKFVWLIIVLMIVAYISVIFVPQIGEMVSEAYQLSVDGIKTFLGINSSNSYEISTGMRYSARQDTLIMLKEELSATKLFFGYGYKYRQIDFPMLQIFVDFGLFGGTLYSVLFFAYPLVKTIKCKTQYNLFDYYYIFNFSSFFSHGQPYDYSLLIPVALWYALSSSSKYKAEVKKTIKTFSVSFPEFSFISNFKAKGNKRRIELKDYFLKNFHLSDVVKRCYLKKNKQR